MLVARTAKFTLAFFTMPFSFSSRHENLCLGIVDEVFIPSNQWQERMTSTPTCIGLRDMIEIHRVTDKDTSNFESLVSDLASNHVPDLPFLQSRIAPGQQRPSISFVLHDHRQHDAPPPLPDAPKSKSFAGSGKALGGEVQGGIRLALDLRVGHIGTVDTRVTLFRWLSVYSRLLS